MTITHQLHKHYSVLGVVKISKSRLILSKCVLFRVHYVIRHATSLCITAQPRTVDST